MKLHRKILVDHPYARPRSHSGELMPHRSCWADRGPSNRSPRGGRSTSSSPGGTSDYPRPTFAVTEQPRATSSRHHNACTAGKVYGMCLSAIRRWLYDLLPDRFCRHSDGIGGHGGGGLYARAGSTRGRKEEALRVEKEVVVSSHPI